MSNGASNNKIDTKEDIDKFQDALDYVTQYLARLIAEDGEA